MKLRNMKLKESVEMLEVENGNVKEEHMKVLEKKRIKIVIEN